MQLQGSFLRGWTGWTSLSYAATGGCFQTVLLLLDKGADISVTDNDNWAPTYRTVRKGHIGIFNCLTDYCGLSFIRNKHLVNLLVCTAHCGDIVSVKSLLNLQVNVNEESSTYRCTALLIAASSGQHAIVELLLTTDDIDINSQDNLGRTALAHAAINGHQKIAELLCGYESVDIELKDIYGATPLSLAARHGHGGVVDLLLSTERAVVTSQDCFGRTPLSYAIECGHGGVQQLLEDFIEGGHPLDVYKKKRPGTSQTLFVRTQRSCDVCTLGIEADDDFYYCEECHWAGFDICLDICAKCYHLGGRCPGSSHKLYLATEHMSPWYYAREDYPALVIA